MSFFDTTADNLRFPLSSTSTISLRRAQIAAAHSIHAHFWASTKPALVVMPTGSGKTAVMIIASIMLRPQRMLVIAPSRLLREQLAEAFTSLDILKKTGAIEPETAGPHVVENRHKINRTREWKALRSANIVVSTPHTISPHIGDIPTPPQDLFDLVIFDEAHHCPAPTYAALARCFPKARCVMFTATPFRRDDREIAGELVFTYTVRQARQDGVYGRLHFTAVEPPKEGSFDKAIACAAAAQLLQDRSQGYSHSLLVRAAGTSRAEALATIYSKYTSLKLKQLHSHLSQKTINLTLRDLRSGALDGVIAVDMLGEGFDFPNFKVAALHAPHKSLAVTLQFIGRFARTSPDTGRATFFAVLDEIKGEAANIYIPGAEWNEIVEAVSRDRIAEEAEVRSFIKSFAPQRAEHYSAVKDEALNDDNSDDDALSLLRTVRPYFHVKAYHALGVVNLEADLQVPRGIRPVLIRRSESHHALVYIGRQETPVTWSRSESWTGVSYELFIIIYQPKHKHLFICTSRREASVYDALVESVLGEKHRRLAPNEITRVLHNIRSPEFFSIGMRNRAGVGGAGSESYRQYNGRAADRAIRAGDGEMYDRGHGFARGYLHSDATTIGFSSSSKVWANRRGPLIELLLWTKEISERLADTRDVTTGSGIDYLRSSTRITQLPCGVVAAALPDEAYQREGALVTLGDSEHWLIDFSASVTRSSNILIEFELRCGSIALQYEMSLGRDGAIRALNKQGSQAHLTDSAGRHEEPLLDYLNENHVLFYLEDLSVVRADNLSEPPSRGAGLGQIRDQILGINWTAERVSPYVEKPPAENGLLSLFEFVERQLTPHCSVLFADDGSGEIADYVSISETAERVLVQLVHCKKASKGRRTDGRPAPVPNNVVDDLYEVVGQAVKSRRWADGRKLPEQFRHRITKSSRFIKGTVEQAEQMLSNPTRLAFEVLIVQPAISTEPKQAVEHLLLAADGYMRGASLLPLRIWGSAPPRSTK